ncbi:MAG: hypothetical protein RDV48_16820 [Candidatus Eremiobacteraeota bacterium]|nr:hypothetical protein [Candidatus Eremiobacteraeota bacterium]
MEKLQALAFHYGVSLNVLASLYAAKVVLFWISFALAVRCMRRKNYHGAVFWSVTALLFGISPYTYLLVVGRGFPAWLTALLASLAVAFAFTVSWKLRRKAAGECTPR